MEEVRAFAEKRFFHLTNLHRKDIGIAVFSGAPPLRVS